MVAVCYNDLDRMPRQVGKQDQMAHSQLCRRANGSCVWLSMERLIEAKIYTLYTKEKSFFQILHSNS